APPPRSRNGVPGDSDESYRARIAQFGGCYPGDNVPDPALIARAARITERFLGGNYAILDGIERSKYRYPSEWILKAVRRIAIKNKTIRNWQYIERGLAAWLDAGQTDPGPEDSVDDDLRPLPPHVAPRVAPETVPQYTDEERI